jgi:WhiB family redox-sensing transcriptional regulator
MTAPANWRDDAACRDADPDLFFPIGTAGPALRQIGEAKRICRTCSAQAQCLSWALDNGVTDGVWGGTTEDERRAIRSLPRTMATSQEDDDGESYQPAEQREQGIRAQAAQGKATRILSGAGTGRGPGGTGAKVTRDAARRQRFRGLVTSSVTPLGAADLVQAIAGRLRFTPSAGVHDDRAGSCPCGGFARDFATADGERVRVEASTRRQFADLAKATRLARTFAFLERVLDADFCARDDLYTHRVTIAALLAPWFARRTVAGLAAAFAGTSVPWRIFTTSPASRNPDTRLGETGWPPIAGFARQIRIDRATRNCSARPTRWAG